MNFSSAMDSSLSSVSSKEIGTILTLDSISQPDGPQDMLIVMFPTGVVAILLGDNTFCSELKGFVLLSGLLAS